MKQCFIRGQKAFEMLDRDIKMNTLRQGYIFEGCEGIGKKTMARKFAQMIFCSEDDKPCGKCHGCRMFEAGTHPDFFTLDESPVKIDSVRRLNDELFIKPLIADKKVFIVEHADEMNNESQNAFLKSFEEPPKYAVIILITSSIYKLLPTIISRGTRVSFSPFGEDEIAMFVRDKYSLSGARGMFAARYSGGIVGRAVDICENEDILNKRDKLIKALCGLNEEKISILDVLEALGATGREKDADFDFLFDTVMSFFRDAAAVKSSGRLINVDYRREIEDFAGKIKASSARGVINVLSDTKAKMCANIKAKMKYDLWMTDMLINCWEEIYGTGNRS